MSDDYDWTPHLQDGEEVLWQGRPDGRAFFLCWQDFGVLFALGWNAYLFPALFFLPENGGIGLATILIVASLAYWLFSRFIWDLIVRRRARYAITNQRLLFANADQSSLTYSRSLSHIWSAFESGTTYPKIVFTPSSKFGWYQRTFAYLDGPPLMLSFIFNQDVMFRYLRDPKTALDIAIRAKEASHP